MDVRKIVAEIDSEISRLQNARKIIAGLGTGSVTGTTGKRTMSAAGRARIAAAQRLRWSKLKKAKKKH